MPTLYQWTLGVCARKDNEGLDLLLALQAGLE